MFQMQDRFSGLAFADCRIIFFDSLKAGKPLYFLPFAFWKNTYIQRVQLSWRGSETTGLPVTGAAFRPQGVEQVNRNKRQRTAASIEVAEGEPFLGACKERFPRQSCVSFFHSRFWFFEDCLPSMMDIDARSPYKSSVSKL